MTTAVVVGAGVVGCAIAYHLARDGADVTLVERGEPAAAKGATWASAGGLRSQGRRPEEHPITCLAAARWRGLSDELGADLEARLDGHLHLAETEAEAVAVEARVAADRAGDIPVERVEGAALRVLAPNLAPGVLLGAFTPGDGQAHPGRTAAALAAAAVREGAMILRHAPARLKRSGDRLAGVALPEGRRLHADVVVLAAGAWSLGCLAGLGLDLPVRARGLQMLLSEVAPPLLGPTVTAVGRNLSLKQVPSGQMMVGGRWFARPVGVEPGVEPIDDHVARQWNAAVAVLPRMSALSLAQSWAGAEAQSLDGLPFVGPTELDGLYVATGFSGHGFQIAPAIGELVARDLLAGPEPLLAPFRPGRRAGDADALAAFRAEPIVLHA